jgi:hypothetical protein
MSRPLSFAEREKAIRLLQRGCTPREISKQIPFVGYKEICLFLEAYAEEQRDKNPARMSVGAAYFEFPEDNPRQLAKRLGYQESEVRILLDKAGLPYHKKEKRG